MIILCMLYIVKIMVDIGKLLRCHYPEHTYPTTINKVKVKDIRKVAIEQYGFINSKYPKRFLLFRNLFRKHRSIHRDINIDEIIDKC